MAKRILVPLEETVRAESMIEAVAALSRGAGAFVRLLHVAPSPRISTRRPVRISRSRHAASNGSGPCVV